MGEGGIAGRTKGVGGMCRVVCLLLLPTLLLLEPVLRILGESRAGDGGNWCWGKGDGDGAKA